MRWPRSLRRLRRRLVGARSAPQVVVDDGRMARHEFLRNLHGLLTPRNYLEIGVSDGRSLVLSRAPSIGVDPAFKITAPIHCDVQLVKATSDDFFAQADPLAHFRGSSGRLGGRRPSQPASGGDSPSTGLDLSFIDGMHLFEFALRDFMNVERYSSWYSVIVFDDMLPRNVDEAARDRHTLDWTGDVYKIIPVLARYRPDLIAIPLDTSPTGILVVLGADPGNAALRDHYDEIVAEWVVPDPQSIPREIIERRNAMAAEELLASELWAELVVARGSSTSDAEGRDLLRRRVGAIVR
jgi:hypothetical protein